MKIIELRRHSVRGGGKGLTPHGIQLARSARKTLNPPYRLVLSSPKRRCVETARAFGFKRVLIDPRLGPLDYSLFDKLEPRIKQLRKKKPGLSWIEAAFRVQGARGLFKDAAKNFLETAADIAYFLKDDERAAVFMHGDVLEAAALLGYPRYDLKALGRPFNPCEGVELLFDGERLAGARPIRLQTIGRAGIVVEAPERETAPEDEETPPSETSEASAAASEPVIAG